MFILQFKGKVQLYLKAIMDLYSLGWLSEKKGKLQDDWGEEQRCNFTNYLQHSLIWCLISRCRPLV